MPLKIHAQLYIVYSHECGEKNAANVFIFIKTVENLYLFKF